MQIYYYIVMTTSNDEQEKEIYGFYDIDQENEDNQYINNNDDRYDIMYEQEEEVLCNK